VSGRRWLVLLIVGAAAALLVGRGFAQIYADYLWYASLGATDIWRARYASLLILRLVCTVAATAFVFVNLYAVRQSVVSLVLPRRIGNLDIGEEVPRRQLTWTAALLSLLLGIALAWPQRNWSAFLAARIGQAFGESDPYFAADLGFFVYRLPMELSLFTWAMSVVLIVIVLVLLLYALTPSLRWEQGGLYISGYVRRHLAMLAGVLLLLLAWHYRLQMYLILGDGSGPEGAFAYIDHRVSIPASLLLSLVTLGAGLTVLWAGWSGQMRMVFAALTGVLISALAARQLAPFIAKRSFAGRDPTVRERPYEAIRAGYTRRAYGVDRIGRADSTLMFSSLAEAAAFVPAWDDGALRRATERSSAATTVGWVASDSGVTAIVPAAAQGSPVVVYDASTVESGGLPVRRIPEPRSDVGVPAVLFGPDSITDTPARVVADSSNRIAAPSLSSALSRFAMALSVQDFRIWFRDPPAPMPKLLVRRTVRERIGAVAPFFAQGGSIAPIWYADTLMWALELYSASGTYPLSRRQNVVGLERAYFQHAATALVNATTGRTVLIPDSIPDPIASTWIARFPRLFPRASSLPLALRRQLPPARDGARVQAAAYGRFGNRTETSPVRHLPDDEGPDSALVESAAPLLIFPRAGTSGYVLPLLDRGERVAGLMIALGGAGHRSVWLPSPEGAPIWSEALDRLRAADTISASLLVRGYVRPVPLGRQMMLVQPRYDWRGNAAPRLLYVATIVGDSVRPGATLLELSGRAPVVAPAGSTGDVRARARELYDEMRRSAIRGDWAAYGRAFDALGALLRRP